MTRLPLVEHPHINTKSHFVPYVEAHGMYRPEGMTADELKAISQYNQYYESNEKLVWNDLYGHASILKQYSGYGGTIRGVVPHGVYSPWAGVSGMETETGLKAVFNWLPYFDCYYRQCGCFDEVVPMAAPFLYALQVLDYKPSEQKGEGTIFIPYHSTDLWDFDDDWYHLVIELRKKNYPQPFAVLLFFEDVRKGRHRFFQKKGIPVYTCGDKFRPEFLYQFIHVVRNFEYVLINDISSPAYYAAAMGKKVITHGDFGVRYENRQTPWGPRSPDGRPFPQDAYDTFATPSPKQVDYAMWVLRACAFQTPGMMKAMFEGVEYDALQECCTEEVHAREASEDCCPVGQEVREQDEEGVKACLSTES